MVVSCLRCTPPGGVGCATTAGLLARGSTLPAPPSRTFRSSGPPRRRGGRASGSPLTVAGAAADLPPDRGPARAHGVPFSPARAGPTTYKHSFMFWGRASPERRRQGAGRPNSGPVIPDPADRLSKADRPPPCAVIAVALINRIRYQLLTGMADPPWRKPVAGWRGPSAERSVSSWCDRARVSVGSGTPEAPPIAPGAARPGSAPSRVCILGVLRRRRGGRERRRFSTRAARGSTYTRIS